MAGVVIIGDEHGHIELKRVIETNLIERAIAVLAIIFTYIPFKWLYTATRWNISVIKVGVVGVGIRILKCLNEKLA